MDLPPELRLCFIRGVNVFGHNLILMHELEASFRAYVKAHSLPVGFLDYYGATGNLAILSALPEAETQHAVADAVGRLTAILQTRHVSLLASEFAAWPIPSSPEGFRWTQGFAACCAGVPSPAAAPVYEAPRVRLRPISQDLAAAYLLEVLTPKGTLDRNRRQGGWTQVSGCAEGAFGGSWTARSLDIVTKLVRNAGGALRRRNAAS